MASMLRRCICATALLAVLATAQFLSAHSAIAAEASDRLLAGCSPKHPPEYFYPANQLRKGVGGRVLLLVERTSKGGLKVLEVVKSEPSEEFIGPARDFLRSISCSKLGAPFTEQVSFSFSVDPAPQIPHFEGVEAKISVRTKIERVR